MIDYSPAIPKDRLFFAFSRSEARRTFVSRSDLIQLNHQDFANTMVWTIIVHRNGLIATCRITLSTNLGASLYRGIDVVVTFVRRHQLAWYNRA